MATDPIIDGQWMQQGRVEEVAVSQGIADARCALPQLGSTAGTIYRMHYENVCSSSVKTFSSEDEIFEPSPRNPPEASATARARPSTSCFSV